MALRAVDAGEKGPSAEPRSRRQAWGRDPRARPLRRRGSERFTDVLTAGEVAGMDHVSLTAMARALHDRVLAREPGYADTLVDLVGLLDELPAATAGAIYLGLLASMYLETGTGTSRMPPESPVAAMLLERLDRPFGDTAVYTIGGRLLGNDRFPLFVPTEEIADAVFDIDVDGGEADQLRSLEINGVEVCAPAQERFPADVSQRGFTRAR